MTDEAPKEETSTEAKALAEILSWSSDCPDWQRDALRRPCESESLSDADVEELLSVCKGKASAAPMTADHIRDPAASSVQVTLAKLSKLRVVGQMRKHLANVKIHHERGDQANWRREVGSFEKDLREAWERAVEDAVSPVIKRLSQKVKTDGLVRLTILEKSDCDTMRGAYGRCSKLIHSQPGELNPKLPTPDYIEREIKALEDWAISIRDRQEQVA